MSEEIVRITELGKEQLVFIKVDKIILEKIEGKPYIEQLKILLGIVREVKKNAAATEETRQACVRSEKAIMRDMCMVNAELN